MVRVMPAVCCTRQARPAVGKQVSKHGHSMCCCMQRRCNEPAAHAMTSFDHTTSQRCRAGRHWIAIVRQSTSPPRLLLLLHCAGWWSRFLCCPAHLGHAARRQRTLSPATGITGRSDIEGPTGGILWAPGGGSDNLCSGAAAPHSLHTS